MASLSIHSVNVQAREDVSQHIRLELDRSTSTYKWVFKKGDITNFAIVPNVHKIRDLKMKDWLDYARALLARVKAGEVAPIELPREERPAEPMPSFMLIGKSQPPPPFSSDPEIQGYNDACRGITACPYGLPGPTEKWSRGHDRAFDEGKAEFPRFGRKVR